jgi:hypothetical protein
MRMNEYLRQTIAFHPFFLHPAAEGDPIILFINMMCKIAFGGRIERNGMYLILVFT